MQVCVKCWPWVCHLTHSPLAQACHVARDRTGRERGQLYFKSVNGGFRRISGTLSTWVEQDFCVCEVMDYIAVILALEHKVSWHLLQESRC